MLIVLLGSGQGLSHGVEYQFRDDAINSIWIFPGRPACRTRACSPAATCSSRTRTTRASRRGVDGVEHITSRFYLRGHLRGPLRGTRPRPSTCAASTPTTATSRTRSSCEGRFLNELDIAEHRKVAVIGDRGARTRCSRRSRAIGKHDRDQRRSPSRSSGVFRTRAARASMEKIYLPITTAQRAFSGANRVGQIMLTTGEAPISSRPRRWREEIAQLARSGTTSPPRTRAPSTSTTTSRSSSGSPSLMRGDPPVRLGRGHRHDPGRRGRRQQHHDDHGARAHARDRRAQGAGRDALVDRRAGPAGVRARHRGRRLRRPGPGRRRARARRRASSRTRSSSATRRST